MFFSFYTKALFRSTAAFLATIISVNFNNSVAPEVRMIPGEAVLKTKLSSQEFLMLKNTNILSQISNKKLTEQKLSLALQKFNLAEKSLYPANNFSEIQASNKLVIAEIITKILALKIWKISYRLADSSTPKNS